LLSPLQETTFYGFTAKVHEPMGVIGIACPDECPLLGFVSLLAPAIIRGNTIIIIPSEKYPLPAVDLYQVRIILVFRKRCWNKKVLLRE
jgi:aldehyde dehydrogenase (NAD+)